MSSDTRRANASLSFSRWSSLRLLDVLLERRGTLADRDHLLGETVGCCSSGFHRACGHTLDLAEAILDAFPDDAFKRVTSFVRELAGALRDDPFDRFAGTFGGMASGFLNLDERGDECGRSLRR